MNLFNIIWLINNLKGKSNEFWKVHTDFRIEIKVIKINKLNEEEKNEILNLFEEYSLIK